MPVCAHPNCYAHVDQRGQVCPDHTKKPARPSVKASADRFNSAKLYMQIIQSSLRAANAKMDSVKYPVFGCGYAIVYLPRQYKFTKWLVERGYAVAHENFTSLVLPSIQNVQLLRTFANAFVTKLAEFDEGYANHIRIEAQET